MKKTKVEKGFYKIRNKKTGLFKGPGTYCSWTENGKTWNQSTIRSGLSMLVDNGYYPEYKGNYDRLVDIEVVKYEMKESEVFDALDFYKGV